MSEQFNPFEQAFSAASGGSDPFAGAVPDPFGQSTPVSMLAATTFAAPAPEAQPATAEAIQEHAPKPESAQEPAPPDLGSQQTAENPFETPEEPETTMQPETQAEIPAKEPGDDKPPAPVIDIESAPGAASRLPETETSNAPVKEISEGVLSPPETGSYPGTAGQQPEQYPESDKSAADNTLVAALEEQDKRSIYAKPPIFEHGAVKEPIEDLEQTFDDLRVAKSDDFPELEDAVRVSWDVTYGKVRKTVPTPKKTKIGEFKKSIETSKEFTDALKKDKDKSPDCVVKPRITAQSKGEKMALPTYKGVYTNLEDAEASGKPITIVPGRDGSVYEVRREEHGTFITRSGECGELSDIRAGFTPALPPIPRKVLQDVIYFFRSQMCEGANYEAIINIYRDRKYNEYVAVIPKQRVTATRAESELTDLYPPERFLHYMDVHSHNVMPAVFSAQDDRDEKATRLYAVIGRLDKPIPEMSVRISNGGKHLPIDPETVFESSADYYPAEWETRGHSGMAAYANNLAKSILLAFGCKGAPQP